MNFFWLDKDKKIELRPSRTFVARTHQCWNGHDTWTRDNFLRVSDTFQTGHDFMLEVFVVHNQKQMRASY